MAGEAAEAFRHDGYAVVRGLLPERAAAKLDLHARRRGRSGEGDFADGQVTGSPSFYADPAMETLLVELLPVIAGISGKALYPTYSYFRAYRKGATLEKHTDREACEVSVSICLGYSGTQGWPIWIEGRNGTTAVTLEPGDGIVYLGIECPHWRDEFREDRIEQVFLHYVDQAGPYQALRYDGRDRLEPLDGRLLTDEEITRRIEC